jgi:hypothetical protein
MAGPLFVGLFYRRTLLPLAYLTECFQFPRLFFYLSWDFIDEIVSPVDFPRDVLISRKIEGYLISFVKVFYDPEAVNVPGILR